jgi:hypothetical protein
MNNSIYIINDVEDGKPIITSFTEKRALEALDEYMGIGMERNNAVLIENIKIEYSEFEDPLVRVLKYSDVFNNETYIAEFKLYCLEIE